MSDQYDEVPPEIQCYFCCNVIHLGAVCTWVTSSVFHKSMQAVPVCESCINKMSKINDSLLT